MRVNILGLKRLTERVLPTMNPGGAIVNTASTAGNQWPSNFESIKSLLSLSSWDESIAWVHDNMTVVADGYFFSTGEKAGMRASVKPICSWSAGL